MTKQNRPAKPPSKTAIARAERAARVEARQRKRESDARRLEVAREQLREAAKSMPAEHQDWGVIRTRAYVKLLEIATSKVDNVTVKPAALEGYLRELRRASAWTLEYCQHLANLHSRAADISAPEAETV